MHIAHYLESGGDVNQRGKFGTTLLMFAAQEGQTPIIDLLLRAGADINGTSEHSSTAISLAALAGHTRVVELLLDRGALVSDHAAGMPLLGLFAITAPSISESLIFYRRERLLRITHEV